ncbi:unnamed protein product [Paramecium octaurelia]|uniref:Uncharacterized protein n=1 Tax=Paramecium octaurelia TaxID=43137 RepID=A0A8S1Y8M9_PAROT|nr:unnamed protein product [Paramecium octaurelia]
MINILICYKQAIAMDLVVMQCTLQKRTPRRMDTSNHETYLLGGTTPAKIRNRKISTTSPQVRYHSQADKKYEDKGVGCDLFEITSITKTFQFNMPQIENFQQPPLIPNKKVLKKKNGLIIFKPIPKEYHLRTFYQSPKNQTSINQSRRRDWRLRKMMDTEIMKSSLEKEKWFTDRNCRIFLNDLWSDSYFQ